MGEEAKQVISVYCMFPVSFITYETFIPFHSMHLL